MENVAILIDNSDSRITYTGSRWRLDTENSTNTLGRSQQIYDIEGTGEDASVAFGPILTKGFEIYGTVIEDLEIDAYIDGYAHNFLDKSEQEVPGKRGVKLFEAGIVQGRHNLKLKPKRGDFTLDYILCEPFSKTNLNGEDLIFDDSTVSFNYTGSWTSVTPDLPQFPFNHTLMSTSEVGASLFIPFTGSSITVYGGFNPSPGLVAADFSVDDSAPSSLVLVNRTSEQSGWSLHRQFFQYNVTQNPQNEHVLHIAVRDASPSQPFFIDYVVVRGNEHSRIAERSFKKTGSGLKSAGMNIGLSFMAIILVILSAVAWRLYRKRRKAKALLPNPT